MLGSPDLQPVERFWASYKIFWSPLTAAVVEGNSRMTMSDGANDCSLNVERPSSDPEAGLVGVHTADKG